MAFSRPFRVFTKPGLVPRPRRGRGKATLNDRLSSQVLFDFFADASSGQKDFSPESLVTGFEPERPRPAKVQIKRRLSSRPLASIATERKHKVNSGRTILIQRLSFCRFISIPLFEIGEECLLRQFLLPIEIEIVTHGLESYPERTQDSTYLRKSAACLP